MRLIRLLIPFVALSALCWAQASDTSQKSDAAAAKPAQPPAEPAPSATNNSNLHLTVVKTVISPSETTNGIGDLQCDDNGNIYLGTDAAAYPGIRKLNSKGELIASFKPDTNPDVTIMGAGHYFVTRDGEVYQSVFAKDEPTRYVLIFKNDGTYKSNIKLEPGFGWIPANVSVFPHGELLMTGQQFAKARPSIPVTGIFSAGGQLLKRLDLEGDGPIKEAALANKAPLDALPTDHTITWGKSAVANDGNVYVMRYLSPAMVYAISPGGEVVRSFTVDPGISGAMPVEMRTSGNRIAIFFTQRSTHEKTMKIVDLEGHELATYDDQKTDGKNKPAPLIAFACYTATPERFTFVTYGEQGKIHLQEVEAR